MQIFRTCFLLCLAVCGNYAGVSREQGLFQGGEMWQKENIVERRLLIEVGQVFQAALIVVGIILLNPSFQPFA
jgi:hypothetical protein